MPEPNTPIDAPEPRDDLGTRLDALGRSLAARESAEPSPAMLAAVRARRTRPLALRMGMLAAAAVAIVCGAVYFANRKPPETTSRPITDGSLIAPLSPDVSTPTLATLRRINPDPAPEALRLPTIATTTFPTTHARPADARDLSSLSRVPGLYR